jgi:hypothetical protein
VSSKKHEHLTLREYLGSHPCFGPRCSSFQFPVSCVSFLLLFFSSSCVSCAQCCQCLGVVFVVCLVCPMLPVSRGCPFLIGAGSVYPFESPEFIPPVVSEVFLLSNYMFLAPCCVVMFAIMLGSPMHTYMCNMFFVFIYVYWLYTRYSYQKICRLKVTRRNCIP